MGIDAAEFSPKGASGGYSIFYAKIAVEGAMWLWFAGLAEQSQLSRWARRGILYQGDPNDPSVNVISKFYLGYTRAKFVHEVQGLQVSKSGSDASLTWKANLDKVSYYRIRRGTDRFNLSVIADGNYDVAVTFPKKVEWDQSRLLSVLNGMSPEDAKHYASATYKVDERKFVAAPPNVQAQLEYCRTVSVGKIKIEIKEQQDAA